MLKLIRTDVAFALLDPIQLLIGISCLWSLDGLAPQKARCLICKDLNDWLLSSHSETFREGGGNLFLSLRFLKAYSSGGVRSLNSGNFVLVLEQLCCTFIQSNLSLARAVSNLLHLSFLIQTTVVCVLNELHHAGWTWLFAHWNDVGYCFRNFKVRQPWHQL